MCCSKEQPKKKVAKLSKKEAYQSATKIQRNVVTELSEGLDLQLWASEKLLADPTALDINNNGEAYVAITSRRRSNEFIDTFHKRWTIPSSSFTTVEDRRNFLKRVLASSNSDSNKWLSDRNSDGSHDWKDLTLQKEKILNIKDTNDDGIADQSQQYFEGFHKLVTGTIGAVLNSNGYVYAGVAPNLWRLKDTNGDGIADEKKSLSYGYGIRIGIRGHNMSGLIKGPDGRLYWSSGSHGINVTGPNGKKWEYPGQGVIMRCEPDGSRLQVFARGVRNTYGISFDHYGNLIAVDNDGDYRGEYERIVYLVNGSDSGWRSNWQYGKFSDPKNNDYNPWMDENYFRIHPENQAAFLLPPIAPYAHPPAGIAYNPGTALGGEWKNYFFVGGFAGSLPKSGIDAFKLKPRGASFTLEDEQKILRGILVTNLDFGPDGALYVSDWVNGWTTDGKGRIWKLINKKDRRSTHIENEKKPKKVLAENFAKRSQKDLLRLLRYPDMRVREKAQFELASRGDAQPFLKAVKQTKYHIERIHGIWGLWQLARKDTVQANLLSLFLNDSDPEIRAQAAKVLGDVRYQPAAKHLVSLLKDKSNRVVFFATQALGQLKYHPAIQPIIDMLAAHQDTDVYIRQAGAIALARIGDAKAIGDLANNPSKAVRIAAVVALRRLESPRVARFLHDNSQYIVTAAARAINDDAQIKKGIPKLAKLLDKQTFTNEALVRREINACLYSGTPEDARQLAEFAARKGVANEMRIEAIRTLGIWPDPSMLDRVTGRYRGKLNHDVATAQKALAGEVVDSLLGQDSPDVRAAAAIMVGRLKYHVAASRLFEMVKDDSSPDVRIAALKSLQVMKHKKLYRAVETALHDQNKQVRSTVVDMMPDMHIAQAKAVNILKSILKSGGAREQQSVLQVLGQMHNRAADQILNQQIDKLMDGKLAPEIQLDLLTAVQKSHSKKLKAKAKRYQDSKPKNDRVAAYREALKGGDRTSGRHIFFDNKNAACIRCHTMDGSGGRVGPDLSHIGSKLSRRQLLQSLMDPTARIAPGFGNVTVILDDGNKIQGTLSKEADSYLIIKTSSGHKRRVLKSKIDKRKNAPSAMPPMGNRLTQHELRNLVEFLKYRK